MKQISLRLPDELYEGVEQERGLVPRETWIKDKLASAVDSASTLRKLDEAQAKAKPRDDS